MAGKRIFPEFLRISAIPHLKLKPYALQIGMKETIYINDAQLLLILKDLLAFNFEVLMATDGQYGSSLPNGTWNGMVGMVQREEADIAMSKIAISEIRMKVIDYSFPYYYSPITFITDKPEYLPNRYAIVYPFSLSVWIAVVATLLVIMFLCYVFKNKSVPVEKMVMAVYGVLLENALSLNLQKLSAKMLIFSWVTGAMFITYSYQAVLLSFLTFPTTSGIRDISELSKASERSSFRCSTYEGSYIQATLLSSTDESSTKIAECLNRNQMYTSSNFEEFLRPDTYRKAFIAPKSDLISLQRGYFISDDSFFSTMTGIVIRKTFCCRKVLDEAIHQIASVGLLVKFGKDEEFFRQLDKSNHLKAEEPSPNKMLTLDDVSGAFVLLVLGYSVAAIVFVVEMLLGRKNRRLRHQFGV